MQTPGWFSALADIRRTGLSVLAASGLLVAASVPAARADEAPATLRTDQVTLRLVREAPAADGSVRGALDIDLAPGWKTYWTDPGAAGIPPTIDFSKTGNLAKADLRLPAPRRFGEGFGRSNGYERPIAAAFTLTPKKGAAIGTVTASVMLGVCHDICIPVQATLTAKPSDDPQAVQAAFAGLPKPNGTGATIGPATAGPKADTLRIPVEAPADGGRPDLFVSEPGGWYFDEPAAPERDGGAYVFTVPVLERPPGATGAPARVDAIFTAGRTAVEADGLSVGAGS
ncbi:protein-disulfide reductase DsbD domain-containing protein [Jiella sp. M17.18]|uniref:protein-disulfide reductase DsbD domain-containing protein n=1 Tax=Jiella sp. M17.18 TaxID=3234247 RepID=UPI0034DFD33A